jgi:hypothetical protein
MPPRRTPRRKARSRDARRTPAHASAR